MEPDHLVRSLQKMNFHFQLENLHKDDEIHILET